MQKAVWRRVIHQSPCQHQQRGQAGAAQQDVALGFHSSSTSAAIALAIISSRIVRICFSGGSGANPLSFRIHWHFSDPAMNETHVFGRVG